MNIYSTVLNLSPNKKGYNKIEVLVSHNSLLTLSHLRISRFILLFRWFNSYSYRTIILYVNLHHCSKFPIWKKKKSKINEGRLDFLWVSVKVTLFIHISACIIRHWYGTFSTWVGLERTSIRPYRTLSYSKNILK